MDEKKIKVWTVLNGETLEIKVDDVVYVPVSKDFLQFDGKMWNRKDKKLGNRYVKHKKYNRQNKLIGWLYGKKSGFCFTMDDFIREADADAVRCNRYIDKLKMLEDDNYVESIVYPNEATKYVVLKNLKL